MDRAIPITLWCNNALWNLLPATSKVNNKKQDKLPTQGLLRKRKYALIDCWGNLYQGFPECFECEVQRLMEKECFPSQNEEASLFDQVYTFESLKKYKPHPMAYQQVLEDLQVNADEVLMVAAHAWDLAGAKAVGLQTAFIARPGKTLYPNAARPDDVLPNLHALVELVQVRHSGSRKDGEP